MKHPAVFSKGLIDIFDEMLKLANAKTVIDPFAGTGKIHELRKRGYVTFGIEIEPEWAEMNPYTQVGDALALPFEAQTFDAVCTSPTYGNRFADKHEARDGSRRRSYTHDIGRQLHAHNSGGMQWGEGYRKFHRTAWCEARRVLKDGGVFVLNVKDHIRGGQRQFVAGWHVSWLCNIGFDLLYHEALPTGGMRDGANRELRVDDEQIYVLRKVA